MQIRLPKCCQWVVVNLVAVVSITCSLQVLAVPELRTIAPQSDYDVSHSYFVALLQLVLDETERNYGKAKVVHAIKMEQGRAFQELKKGALIDVYWAGTSLAREEEYRAIRVPLLKGLLGYRLSIIRAELEKDFLRINQLSDLKAYTACQGMHWPDSDILENAGLQVRRGPIYELLFRQVAAGRCDYFPRGIHEGGAEMRARQEKFPNLRVFTDVLIYYPFPMYFFVKKDNEALADRLEQGLEKAISQGSFEQLLLNHPITSELFPLTQWGNKKIISLKNPLLPEETPRAHRYWIRPDDLRITIE